AERLSWIKMASKSLTKNAKQPAYPCLRTHATRPRVPSNISIRKSRQSVRGALFFTERAQLKAQMSISIPKFFLCSKNLACRHTSIGGWPTRLKKFWMQFAGSNASEKIFAKETNE